LVKERKRLTKYAAYDAEKVTEIDKSLTRLMVQLQRESLEKDFKALTEHKMKKSKTAAIFKFKKKSLQALKQLVLKQLLSWTL